MKKIEDQNTLVRPAWEGGCSKGRGERAGVPSQPGGGNARVTIPFRTQAGGVTWLIGTGDCFTACLITNHSGPPPKVFIVDVRANKGQIRSAVQRMYDIQTQKINTLIR
jgi:hypothetical protein